MIARTRGAKLPALFSSLIALLPLVAGSVQVSDTARVAARNSLVDDRAILEVDDTLRLQLSAATPRLQLSAAYAPRLSLIQELSPAESTWALLHGADARIQYQVPRFTLALTEQLSFGRQGFVDLVSAVPLEAAPGSPPAVAVPVVTTPRFTLLPGTQAVAVGASRTLGSAYYRFTPQWSSELRASYEFSGGRGAEAQLFLPRQDAANSQLTVAYAQTEHSRWTLGVSGTRIWTSQDFRYWLYGFSAGWSARLAPRSTVALSAGSTRQDTRTPEDVRIEAWVPLAAASFSHQAIIGRASYFGITARADYAPYVNVLLGRMQEQLSGTLLVDVRRQRLAAALAGTLAQTFPLNADNAARSVGGNATLSYAVSERVDTVAGLQLAKQYVNVPLAASGLFWIAYLEVSVRSAPLAF